MFYNSDKLWYLTYDILIPPETSAASLDVCPIWKSWLTDFLKQVVNKSFEFSPNMAGHMLLLKNNTPDGTASFSCLMDYPSPNFTRIIAFSIVILLAVTGNLTILLSLWKSRRRWTRSRINFFIMHLAVADLIVMITPLVEVIWGVNITWHGGQVLCKIYKFLSTFGLYLSSYSIVCIAMDRFFAIVKPSSIKKSRNRGYIMLLLSWILASLFSIPQLFVFKTIRHGFYGRWYTQCMERFEISHEQRKMYNFTAFALMYGLPLIIIAVVYATILVILTMKTKEQPIQQSMSEGQFSNSTEYLRSSRHNVDVNCVLRSSNNGNIVRARMRTLRMTLIIVFVFLCCWAPYWVMAIFWSIQEDAASQINTHVADILMIFALSNSCVNPLVYGMLTDHFSSYLQHCCCFVQLCQHHNRQLHRTNSSLRINNNRQEHMAQVELMLPKMNSSHPSQTPLHQTSSKIGQALHKSICSCSDCSGVKPRESSCPSAAMPITDGTITKYQMRSFRHNWQMCCSSCNEPKLLLHQQQQQLLQQSQHGCKQKMKHSNLEEDIQTRFNHVQQISPTSPASIAAIGTEMSTISSEQILYLSHAHSVPQVTLNYGKIHRKSIAQYRNKNGYLVLPKINNQNDALNTENSLSGTSASGENSGQRKSYNNLSIVRPYHLQLEHENHWIHKSQLKSNSMTSCFISSSKSNRCLRNDFTVSQLYRN